MIEILKDTEKTEVTQVKVITSTTEEIPSTVEYWDGFVWTKVFPLGPVVADYYTVGETGILALTPDFKTAISNNTEYKEWTPSSPLPSFSGLEGVTSLHKVFENLQMVNIDLSLWDFSNITNMAEMFRGCNQLETFSLSDKTFSTEPVNLYRTFYNCSKLRSIDFVNCGDIVPSSMQGYIQNSSLLTNISIENINISTITEDNLPTVLTDAFKSGSTFIGYAKDNDTAGKFNTHGGKTSGAYFTADKQLNNFYIIIPSATGIGTIRLNPDFAVALNDNVDYYGESGRLWVAGTPLPNPNPQGTLKTLSNLFFEMRVASLDLSSFNFTGVESVSNTFRDCTTLNNVVLPSGIDNASITNASGLFNGCTNLVNVPIGIINGAPLTTLANTFNGCTKMTSIDLSSLNLVDLTSLAGTFYNCRNLETIDLSTHTINLVGSMYDFASGCEVLTTYKSFATNTTSLNLTSAFEGCITMSTVNLTGFDPVVLNLERSFYNCRNVEEINFTLVESKVTNLHSAFYGASKLKFLDFTNMDVLDIIKTQAFTGCNAMTGGYAKSFTEADQLNNRGTTGLKSGVYFTYNGPSAAFYNVSNKKLSLNPSFKLAVDNNTNFVKDSELLWTAGDPLPAIPIDANSLEGVFKGMKKVSQIDLSLWDTSNITNVAELFMDCSAITSLDLSSLNLENVTNMYRPFYNCSNITNIILPYIESSNLTSSSYMCYGCTKLENINIEALNFMNMPYLDYMFFNCQSLTGTIDTSLWRIDNTKYYRILNTFHNTIKLNSLILKDIKFNYGNASFTIRDSYLLGTGCGVTNITLENVTFANDSNKTNNMFANCKKLTHIYAKNVLFESTGTISSLFLGNTSLQYIELNGFLFPTTTHLTSLLRSCTTLTQTSIIGILNAPSCVALYYAFTSCSNITNIDFLSTWNLPVIQNMSNIFSYNTGLTNANMDIFHFDTLTTLDYAFANCINLVTVVNDTQELSSVTSMQSIFNNTGITDVSFLSTLKIPNIENLSNAFYKTKVTNVNISLLNPFTKLTNITDLFENCTLLTSATIDNISTQYINMANIFTNCTNISTIVLKNLKLSNAEGSVAKYPTGLLDYARTFLGILSKIDTITLDTITLQENISCKAMLAGIKNFTLNNVNFGKPTDISYMFADNKTITSITVPDMDLQNCTTLEGMFSDMTNLTSVTFNNNTTANVNNISFMFAFAQNISNISLNINTIQVRNMKYMFYRCTSLQSFDFLNTLNFEHLEDMSYMFALTGKDTITNFILPSSLNTTSIKNISGLFYDSKYTNIDISLLNITNVTNVSELFNGCELLNNLALPTTTSNGLITKADSVFRDCTELTSIDLTNFNLINVTSIAAIFYGCSKVQNINFGLTTNNTVLTTITNAFRNTAMLQDISLEKFTGENITSLSGIFYDCALPEDKLLNLIAHMNLSKVTNLSGSFAGTLLTSALSILNNLTFGAVTNIDSIFQNCVLMTVGGLGKLNPEIITSIEKSFYNTSVNDFSFLNDKTYLKAVNTDSFLTYLKTATELNLANITFPVTSRMNGAFSYNKELKTVKLNNVEFTKATTDALMQENPKLERVYFDNVRMPANNLLEDMFRSSPKIKTFITNNCIFGTSLRTNYMFFDANNNYTLCNIDFSGIDFSKINSSYKRYMFESGTKIYRGVAKDLVSTTNLNTGTGLDTKYKFVPMTNKTDLYYKDETRLFISPRFADALDLNKNLVIDETTLYTINTPIPTPDLTGITDLSHAFRDLELLTTLDLSLWDFSNITDLTDMFINSNNLTTCYVGSQADADKLNNREITKLIETATFVVK